MLRLPLVLPAAFVLVAAACGTPRPAAPSDTGADAPPAADTTVALGSPFTLTRGQSAEVGGQTVRFDAVLEDSRCPQGTTCVWAGRARVTLSVADAGVVALELPGFVTAESEQGHQPVEAHGYRFTLLALDPYPSTEGADSGREARATLRVDQMGD